MNQKLKFQKQKYISRNLLIQTFFMLQLSFGFSTIIILPGSNFFGKTPLFFRYSGVNAANAVNLQAKRR